MRKWHRYRQEFKDHACARLKGCTNVEALARELHVSRGVVARPGGSSGDPATLRCAGIGLSPVAGPPCREGQEV